MAPVRRLADHLVYRGGKIHQPRQRLAIRKRYTHAKSTPHKHPEGRELSTLLSSFLFFLAPTHPVCTRVNTEGGAICVSIHVHMCGSCNTHPHFCPLSPVFYTCGTRHPCMPFTSLFPPQFFFCSLSLTSRLDFSQGQEDDAHRHLSSAVCESVWRDATCIDTVKKKKSHTTTRGTKTEIYSDR